MVEPKNDDDLEFFREEFQDWMHSLDDNLALAFPSWADPNSDWSDRVFRGLTNRTFLVATGAFCVGLFLMWVVILLEIGAWL